MYSILLCYSLIHLQVGKAWYRQTQGVSQGSVLSTLLCSFYYGAMETDIISVAPDDLLMRLVDDFLLVTPSLQQAQRFLARLLKGL